MRRRWLVPEFWRLMWATMVFVVRAFVPRRVTEPVLEDLRSVGRTRE